MHTTKNIFKVKKYQTDDTILTGVAFVLLIISLMIYILQNIKKKTT